MQIDVTTRASGINTSSSRHELRREPEDHSVQFPNITMANPQVLLADLNAGRCSNVAESLPGHGAVPGGSTSKVVHAQKIEPMTISELNQFIITADSQIIEFLCTAKVTGIQQDEGWSYIGCSGCSKKLVREISSFTCLSCNETNAVAALR
ncbi:hypothetical protein F2Q70_00036254 [Brassica cretica]|uniref:Replication factor A C-terminal domain-containing protein n=1 Tax=Brassica cretica TaxID=69181 RepID=A0A8S9GHP9_BRACR|nr:hypothetical protein F2Q68_00031433 [Brassica cretica]KAF2586405.1 hypothetical protein F2Q70_00036254 [Brassica cretica]